MVPERLHLPAPPAEPPRTGFPIVATLAPLALALVLWVVTSSPYSLLFALLGPVVGAASRVDARRQRRRARHAALTAARAELATLGEELERRADAVRRELETRAPDVARIAWDPAARGFRVGRGGIASGVELVGDSAPELAAEVARLRESAALVAAAPVVVEGPELTVVGPDSLARALGRALVLQAVARTAAGVAVVTGPPGEQWLDHLPCRTELGTGWRVVEGERTILSLSRDELARGPVIDLGDERRPPTIDGVEGFRPRLLAAVEATRVAEGLVERARAAGWREPVPLPEQLDLAALLAETADAAPAWAALGRDAAGPVGVDLERDGPHALVAGTTGSGKSELLVSWVIALAARRPPDRISFLLVDFKGGAAFAPLARLPHVTGVVSDLDEVLAARAILSLRAEIRRREAVLAAHGAREVGELPDGAMARLVIVVDEFAALLAAGPELHQVFADLAARGRSLGLHLLIGTQRPTGVVRDAILANVTVRICLRVLEGAESTAMVGVPDAAEIPAASRGRAILRDAESARVMQVARASSGLADEIAARWRGHPGPGPRPWTEPLPAVLAPASVRVATPPRLAFGLVDRPELQRYETLTVDPWAEGAVLVLGATGSGRSTALAALAAACADEVRWIDADPVELWGALGTPPSRRRALVVVDDLDLLLARGELEQQAEIAERLAAAARDVTRTGIAIVASARAAGGRLAALGGGFEHRVLLRLPSRDEHLLAGGETAGFRVDRRPGSGTWRGHEVQIVAATTRPRPWAAPVVTAELSAGPWGLVTPHVEQWRERLARDGIRVSPAGPSPSGRTDGVVLGDVDAWLADPRGIAEARARARLVLHGATRAELRMLTRCRDAPPLGAGEAWLVDSARASRARIVTQASPSTDSSSSIPWAAATGPFTT